jgi:hypothetical protein
MHCNDIGPNRESRVPLAMLPSSLSVTQLVLAQDDDSWAQRRHVRSDYRRGIDNVVVGEMFSHLVALQAASRLLRKPVINLTLTAVDQNTLLTCPNCPIRPLSPIAARKADHLACPIQYHPIQDFAFHISFRPGEQLFWRRQKSFRNESALFRPRYSPAKSDVGSTTLFQ